MENEGIKYYEFIGSQRLADQYMSPKPVKNKIYAENEKIGINIVSYWASESLKGTIYKEWKLVEKQNKAI